MINKATKISLIIMGLFILMINSAIATYFVAPRLLDNEKKLSQITATASSSEMETQVNQATPAATLHQEKKLASSSAQPTPTTTLYSELELELMDFFKTTDCKKININLQNQTHAQGEVGKKWWLAYRSKKMNWEIVASGYSYIDCADISGYNFPSAMAPACWDYHSNQLISR